MIKLSGHLTLITMRDGEIIDIMEEDNLVVTAGILHAAGMLGGTGTPMSHIGVGTGAVAPADGNTTLGSEILRKAATVTVSGDVIRYYSTFGIAEALGLIAEAGLFNAASGGTMMSRVTFPLKNHKAGDVMVAGWTIRVSK